MCRHSSFPGLVQSKVAPSYMYVDFFCALSIAPFRQKKSTLLKKKTLLPAWYLEAAALEGSNSSLSTEQQLAPALAMGITGAPVMLRVN